MCPVEARGNQFRISTQRFQEVPSVHTIGELQLVQGHCAFDWISEDEHNFGVGQSFRNAMAGFRGGEVRRRNLPYWSLMLSREMPAVPLQSAMEVKIEEPGFLRGRVESHRVARPYAASLFRSSEDR